MGWEQPTAPAASEAGATVRCGLIASAVLDKTWAFLSRPETTVFDQCFLSRSTGCCVKQLGRQLLLQIRVASRKILDL